MIKYHTFIVMENSPNHCSMVTIHLKHLGWAHAMGELDPALRSHPLQARRVMGKALPWMGLLS